MAPKNLSALWARLLKLGALLVMGYLTLCLGFFLLQNHELFPGRAMK
jgi:hypothetical protein